VGVLEFQRGFVPIALKSDRRKMGMRVDDSSAKEKYCNITVYCERLT